ncbi:MAG: SDR family NAD(P)-dependent oxidoreductase [Anaerolineae bacterium]
MKEFRDRVAVVTGAASGIGRALAERCAREGMKVVLADIDDEVLNATARAMQAVGATVLAVHTDVSRREDVQALADRTIEAFGAVHLLFNNAGVGAGWTIWETPLLTWEWVLGVNLWGIIHGLQVFVPIMLAQDTDCHVVNTASGAGLIPYMASAPYHVSKHAVVALSEQLYHSLAAAKGRIGASVLCPGFVRTDIMNHERHRPRLYQDDSGPDTFGPAYAAANDSLRHAVEQGIPPERVADRVFRGIREGRLYIITHPEFNAVIRKRSEDILEPWD